MHAVQQNHRHPYTSTTHFNVQGQQSREEGSSGSDSASIDVVVVRGGDEEHDEEEHHYFAPQIKASGVHVESNPSYMTESNKQTRVEDDENPYFNPHYISRTTSAADSITHPSQINGHPSHIQHYPTANGTPIDHLPTPPHYYEVHPQQQNGISTTTVNLIPLALVDREVHSRRISALIPSPLPEHKFVRNSQPVFHQPARVGRRRFSVTTNGTTRKMSGEEVHYAQSGQMFPPPIAQPQQKETLGRRAAQKFLQQKGAFRRTKQGSGGKLAALGSELSQSASALYSLFTTNNNNGTGGGTRNADTLSDDELDFDRRSVLSVDHLHFQRQSHYQQPILSHQMSMESGENQEQIYASANFQQMSQKAFVSMAMQTMMDLTDKTEDVSEHTQRGIEFLEKYGQFAKERALIEDEYALKIRSLVKKYSGKKKDSDEWKAFSYVGAFQLILREVESLAAQHEVISDKLKKEICPTIAQKSQEFRVGRKRHLQELNALNNAYQAQIDNMQRHLKGYTKAYKDAESAHVKFYKADHNMDLSRAEVAKCRQSLQQKIYTCEQAKQHYAAALETTNTAQRSHYNDKIPHLLEEMRRLDVDRIQETKQAMMQCVDVETGVLSIVQRCYNDMRDAIRTIDPPRDTHVVVEQNKTGYPVPNDFEFNDLGCPSKILEGNDESTVDGTINSTATLKRGQIPANGTNGKQIVRKPSMHQRIFGGPGNSNGKSNGSASEYGNLPPQQRCRKIEARLQEIAKDIQTREQSKAGLAKMYDVYTKDPKMGSASDVALQMKQFEKEVAAKKQEMDHYNRLLADTQKEMNVPFSPINSLPQPHTNGLSNGHTSPRMQTISSTSLPANNNRVSYSEDSVSSDGSTVMGVPRRLNGHVSSVHSPHASNTHIPHIDSSAETVSNSNGSHKNVNTSSSTSAAGGDLYEDPDENLTPLGSCKALYAFEGTASGDSTTISMNAGEELHLLEKDDGQGDGWTRVRNPRTGIEGFVPTAYIECRWF